MSCSVTIAATPLSDIPSIRAIRACITRSTGTDRTKSTTRMPAPASTASAAASTTGLRSDAARSLASPAAPTNSPAAALARTIRRCASIRISGSGVAANTASAAARAISARMLRSRQPRARRSADCHSASAVPPSRPRRRVAAASEPGSAWGPSASTACCTADSDSENGAMNTASKIRIAAPAVSAAGRSRRPVTHSPASTAALGSARPNANTGTRRRPRRFMILMALAALGRPALAGRSGGGRASHVFLSAVHG